MMRDPRIFDNITRISRGHDSGQLPKAPKGKHQTAGSAVQTHRIAYRRKVEDPWLRPQNHDEAWPGQGRVTMQMMQLSSSM